MQLPKTAAYTRGYAGSNGFLALLSDGERLTGAYAFDPEAGERLQQATLAIRAHIPFDVLGDTIQPFPTFSEIYLASLKALRAEIAATPKPVGAGPPMTPPDERSADEHCKCRFAGPTTHAWPCPSPGQDSLCPISVVGLQAQEQGSRTRRRRG